MVIGDMPAEPRTGHMGCSDPQPFEPTPTSVGSRVVPKGIRGRRGKPLQITDQ